MASCQSIEKLPIHYRRIHSSLVKEEPLFVQFHYPDYIPSIRENPSNSIPITVSPRSMVEFSRIDIHVEIFVCHENHPCPVIGTETDASELTRNRLPLRSAFHSQLSRFPSLATTPGLIRAG